MYVCIIPMVIFHHKVQEIPMAAFGTNALTFMGHLGDAPGVATGSELWSKMPVIRQL